MSADAAMGLALAIAVIIVGSRGVSTRKGATGWWVRDRKGNLHLFPAPRKRRRQRR